MLKIHSESMWTTPRPDCPNPGRWHSTDAQSTELEVSELVATFVRALQPSYVVETGTCIGITARMIGEALTANGHGQLVTLEIDPERAAAAAEYCAGLPVEVRCVPSLEFVPDEPIGFAWFDSLLELRVSEFERFRPWLASGTVVGFHDTAPHHGRFGALVESLPGTRSIRLRTPRGVTFTQVL